MKQQQREVATNDAACGEDDDEVEEVLGEELPPSPPRSARSSSSSVRVAVAPVVKGAAGGSTPHRHTGGNLAPILRSANLWRMQQQKAAGGDGGARPPQIAPRAASASAIRRPFQRCRRAHGSRFRFVGDATAAVAEKKHGGGAQNRRPRPLRSGHSSRRLGSNAAATRRGGGSRVGLHRIPSPM